MKNIIIDGVEYTPVIKQSQIVDKHYHFELYPDNLGEMTWDEAVKAVKKLGDGWRLPTIEECFMIYKDKLIDRDFYWSSTEYNAAYAYFFTFLYGYASNYDKTNTFTVRGVRDLINKQD
jgi:hypothetical protein